MGEGKVRVNNGDQKVAFYRLFSFADRLDIMLMIVGMVSAIVTGMAQPMMTLIFGNVINSFGSTTDRSLVVHEVSKVF